MPRDNAALPSSDGVGPDPSTTPVRPPGRVLMLLQGMPFLFGLGFIAPLIAQLLERALLAATQTEWPLLVGLAIGGSWGALANLRGRWL